MSQPMSSVQVANAASSAHLSELVRALVALRPLVKLAFFVLLLGLIAVAHVAVRVRTDQLERELATVEAQASVSEAWNQALALDLETRRSSERLEAVAAELQLAPARKVVVVPARTAQ